jgi:hypothetical protein
VAGDAPVRVIDGDEGQRGFAVASQRIDEVRFVVASERQRLDLMDRGEVYGRFGANLGQKNPSLLEFARP